MNKIMFGLIGLFVIFIMGCQPAAQPPAMPATTAPAPSAPVAAPTSAPSEVPPSPLENIPAPESDEEVDIEQVCYGLLGEGEFESACGYAGRAVLTHKISEKTCWVNIADHQNNKLTAGFTVRDWRKSEEANREFDRGVTMRRTQGAVESKEVGERSYHYQELGRENMAWVRGTFLSDLAAMNALCPADKLNDVAKNIDSRLH